MYRIYVEVTLIHGTDSSIRPLSIKWEDGRVFEIDKLLDVRMAGSLKVEGHGWRYTCRIRNKEVYLFFDRVLNKWYVERK